MTNASTLSIVRNLKEAEQDFEFYPTTPAMIKCVLDDYLDEGDDGRCRRGYKSKYVALDVGAGTGGFLKAALAESGSDVEVLAIEKSHILINELVTFAKVIGTDFHQQSYLDKHVDLLFCNPPYSEYAVWVSRLLRECPARTMYFIIPQRWETNKDILEAVAYRKAEVVILRSFDFLDAERSARAKVHILRVDSKLEEDELFNKFFNARFGDLEARMRDSPEKAKEYRTRSRAGLVEREGYIGALVAIYDLEMATLQSNYDKATSLDAEVLMALGLSAASIVDTLKATIDALKNKYWSELFSNLHTVSHRLTTKNRDKLLTSIGGFKTADFNQDNIYATLLWVIENANSYSDGQILEVFDNMLEKANIQNYKSNKRVYGDGHWRYGNRPEGMSHYTLDYRIILTRRCAMGRWGKHIFLTKSAQEFVKDIITMANLLGLVAVTDDPRFQEGEYNDSDYWKPGKPQLFHTVSGDDLLEVKAHLNGNIHIRMSQELALRMNVAVGKLRGWIRSKPEAVSELGKDAGKAYDMTYRLEPKHMAIMCGKAK